MMQRFKAVVSYDGFDYAGWQIQPAERGATIQQTIQDAISVICQQPVSITGSGRTDAQVHAWGQVFHFDVDFSLNAFQWKRAINGHLPKDIHIRSIEAVDSRFHARFDAIGKRYEYRIQLGEANVFTRRYTFQSPWTLNVQAMREGAAYLIGEHDFSSFCANSRAEMPDQVRTITRLELAEENDQLRLIFEGSGFLRYMVRMMTGTLIEVGRGRLAPQDVQWMLQAQDKQICHFNAKPQGLTLVEVYYPAAAAEAPVDDSALNRKQKEK